jgi:alkanesulfonate monooxygenase SsuD/methylene tetrahydromethanopterin reductase-like flavin-dependent oxidoreductase (luciferase family)
VQAATHTAKLANSRNFDYLLEGGMILCGTPDDLVEQIRRYEEVGATQMLMGISIGDIGHDEVLRSIDLIGQEVIPQFERSPRPAGVTAG